MTTEAKRSPTIIVRDALKDSVEKETGGAVTVLYDEHEMPSYMLVIPRFDAADIDSSLGAGTHPAFVVNGEEKSELFIGQVPACIMDGIACSLPNEEYRYYINHADARAACAAKGKGWHLVTAWEWAALTFWIVKNKSKYFEKNYWEWLDGLKLVDGKLFFPNDNAVDAPEADWPFQSACFDDDEGDPVLSAEISHFTESDPSGADDDRDDGYTYIDSIASINRSESYEKLDPVARQRLARIMIDPVARSVFSAASGGLFVRNYGERFPIRGGHWHSGAAAGLGALNLSNRRSSVSYYIGLRPAFLL